MLFKPDWKPKGVIHIGGHRLDELEYYDSIGVKRSLWIEAISESVDWMVKHSEHRDDVVVFESCISDRVGTSKFYITNNLASSSMLPLGLHEQYHPKIHVTEVREVFTECLDDLFYNVLEENIEDYNAMNIDTQGSELKVLRGAGDILNHMRWIYCEVNKEELYKGCCLVEELDEYLAIFGYKRTKTVWVEGKGWGDSLYEKTDG